MEVRRRPAAVASAALLAVAACASTGYAPRADGRIATTLEDGRPMLTKNGKSVPAGSAGLAEMVAGNPAAEAHVHGYTSSIHLGIAEQLLGLGAMLGGAVVLAPKQDMMGMSEPVSYQRQIAGTVLLVGGVTAFFVSAFQLMSAQAHFQDAINVYNDGVPPPFAPPPPGWQPTSPVPLTPQAPTPGPPAPPQAYPPPPLPPN